LQIKLFDEATGNLKTHFEAINPEVLFSLYTSNESMDSCLSCCFPHKIQVNFSPELSTPKFFTFTQMNELLELSYQHTFIFYEQISASIVNDFDVVKA
jgi:hypothetical protein